MPRLNTTKLRRVELVVLAVQLAVLLLGYGLWTRHDFTETEHQAKADIEAAGLLLEDYVLRSLAAMDGVLLQAADLITEMGLDGVRSENARRRLQSMARTLPPSGAIFIYDSNGDTIASSTSHPPLIFNAADREYFQIIMGGLTEQTIGRALPGRTVHSFFFPVARSIKGSDGTVEAVVQVGVEVDYLGDLFSRAELARGKTFHLHRLPDGALVARYPMSDKFLEESIAEQPFFPELADRGGHWSGWTGASGGRQLLSARRVGGLPLVLTTAMPCQSVFGPAHDRMLLNGLALLAAIGILATLGAMLLLSLKREAQSREQEQRSEQVLRESEERYRSLFEAMTEGFALHEIIVDPDGKPCDYRFLEINPAFERLTDLKRQNLIGKRVQEVFPDIEAYWIDCYGRVALTGEPLRMEQYSSGLGRWYEVFAYRPAPGQFAVVFSNITERRRTEETLRQALAKADEGDRMLSTLMEQVPEGITICDADGTLRLVSQRGQELLGAVHVGKSIDEVVAEWKVYQPDGVTPMATADLPLNRALQGEEPVHDIELVQINSRGEKLHLLCNAAPLRDADGRVAGGIVAWRDITERKEAGEAQRASERRLIGVLESMPDAFVSFDADLRYTYVNANAERLQAARREELLGKDMRTVYSDAESRKTINEYERVIREQRPVTSTSYHGGFDRWVEIRAFPTPDGASVFYKDVSAQVKAEQDLRESEEQFRVLTQNLQTAVALIDQGGAFTIVNSSFLRMFDIPQDATILNVNSRDWSQWQVFDEHGALLDVDEHPVRKAALTRTAVRDQLVAVKSPSSPDLKWLLVSAEPILDMRGDIHRLICTYYDITERKAAEEVLRESREDLDRAQTVGQIGWWRLDTRKNILTWSDENHRIFGVPKGTPLTYEAFLAIVHPDDRRYVDTRWQAGLRGEPYDIEHRIVADGRVKWVREKAYLEFGHEGQLRGGFGITQDITARKLAEEALRESEAKYRNLFENMAEEVHFWKLVRDEAGNIETWRLVDANPPTLKSWGRETVEEIRGKTADEIFGPGATEHYMPVVRKIMTEGVPYSFEDYFPNLDKHFRFTSVPFGEYFITTGADITPIKKAQEALRRSEARWNAAIESFAEGAIIATEDEQVIYWNPAARDMHGFTRPDEGLEPLEKTPITFQLWTPDGSHMLELDEWPMRRIKRGESVRNLELRVRRPDQGWEKIFSYSGAMVDTAGDERLIFLTCHDLTELRKAEWALRESEERFRQVAESLPQLVWACAADGPCDYLSPQWVRYTGKSEAEQLGYAWLEQLHPDDRQRTIAQWQATSAKGDHFEIEFRIRRYDGAYRWFRTMAVPLRDERGHVVKWFGSNTDIDDMKQAEEALRESEERIRASLAEKEVLLKEIHHRVKNNMQVIASLVSLQANDSDDPSMRAVLREVSHRVRSMALVHEKLYQSENLARVEFARYTESLLHYLWRAHGRAASAIELALDLEPVSLSVTTAVPCGLILNELVSNALKHAFSGRGGGVVRVSLRGDAQGQLRLSVRDNGTGLPAGFNWREARTLGLRLVQMLAGQLHATVEVSSDEGTEFAVTIMNARGSRY